ncbi:MAG: shikimate kinase [Akkermansia sp.]|nr:shikimate kinase [Akkermansia sp.]MBR2314056.1 shikimate kinase [Akkermansia sp.]MBR3903454.1 shikimate kinase [Akkermansia sp.]
MIPAPSMVPAPIHPLDTKGRPIILVGLMGCGKTTVGKALSKRTGMPLLDTDAIIEEQIGKSIPEIFEEQGEAHFRALETALLRYLLYNPTPSPSIISTGGGIVVRPENRELLRMLGFTVWLNVSVNALLVRTAKSTNRPLLLNTDRRAVFERLDSERRAFYKESAHLWLEASRMDVNSVAVRVCEEAERFFGAF